MNKVVRNGILVAGCLAVTPFIAWPQAADDPLDSLKVCPTTQRLIFENQFVRVIDDLIPPGVTEPLHRHRRSVVVFLNTSSYEQTTADGRTIAQKRDGDTAGWAEAVVHTVTNVGDSPAHAIRIELKF